MRYNVNEYEIDKDSAKILTAKKEVILIDVEDLDLLKTYSWYISSRGYACTRINNKLVYMHRLLMNPQNLQVDHINRNKLDNRKTNLRVVTNQQNHFNMGINKNNKSGYTGIYFNKECQKWCVQMKINGKYVFSKLFVDLELAIEARKKLEREYFLL